MDENAQPVSENIGVFVRIRPMNQKETSEQESNIVICDYKENILALTKGEVHCRTFKFDHIFGPLSTQLDVYVKVAAPIVEQALTGYNGTIFAYGQTGTGKTYTMAGENNVAELRGIIPNTFSHIFAQIAHASEEKSFVVKVTYLEIYNEEVRDLLSDNPNKKLQIKERTDIGVYVKDLSGFTVDSVESIMKLLNAGNKNRVTRSTLMNDVSSRSHAIFTITIESKNRMSNKTTVGKLNLVDLAGSERASRTQATGERLREASSINQSLSVLGSVISALVDGKQKHIPYRNSKLTRLLQDSLGGNSKTSMIAMLSPAEIDYEESMCTLRYAARVKHIKNHAKINVEEKGLIEGFEQEIAELQAKLSSISLKAQRSKKKEKSSEMNLEKAKKVEEEIENTEKEKKELEERMAQIQKKIIVGGENLLEKAQEQEFLILTSGEEIENLARSHQQLKEQLDKKAEEKIDIEEKYSSLQEEDVGVTKKIKKVQAMLKEEKEEMADKDQEYQREIEGLNDNNSLLVREIQLASLMIESYIPSEYLRKINQHLLWNPETQEYQMRGVAYTGNNMRKRQTTRTQTAEPVQFGMKQVYHKYPEKKREKPKEKRSLLKCYSAVPKSR
ncbi:kinesin-like protein KIF3A [Cylas formicarius]|uniref:kinesin-like protein KIF3A n=1 Tax=Cylas formicarius TaxID=197179 RepID=UPI002958828E|nr:kinesin-like protein KIF3A [Cylas formicarius]